MTAPPNTEPRELYLVLADSNRRVHVPADGREFLIGRSATATLPLADPSCSREHARLRWDGQLLMLEPVALRQPTFVNEIAFDRPTALSDGDVVRCGETSIRVQLVVSEARRTPSGVQRAITGRRPALQLSRSAETQLGDDAIAVASDTPSAPVEARADVVLGRDRALATLVLDHPSISRRHAVILGAATPPTIRDLGSSNGTFVNGVRLVGTHALSDGDTLRLGPYAFEWRQGFLHPQLRVDGEELATNSLVVEVNADSGRRRLLDDVSLAIRAREFVAIIGPSGCGKSTLIRAMSGRSRPTGGSVTWSGEDLHRHFDAVKHEIAFVPQRETLPERLTVRECLSYTARLRLPPDTGADEIERLVKEAIARVGLHEQADLPIHKLSGGQRKRASLGNELLVRPSLMFLDEVTSGLDEATDREMMQVFRSLADSGIAVVCVTHTLANVERWCDSLLVMARGGVVAFHGPVSRARAHFGAAALGDIYESLESIAPQEWRPRHEAGSPYHDRTRTNTAGRAHLTIARDGAPRDAVERDRRRPGAQFLVLTSRYLDTTLADRRTLAMAAIQSVVIGAFLRLVFGGAAPAPQKEYMLLFLLGVSAFWFGCNNAAKEIIKERALFELERDVNLRIPSYVLSKLAILSAVGGLQVLILVLIVRLAGLTYHEPGAILAVMLLTLVAGTACGLFISAAAASEDQAITIVPIALIPQILLSDAVVTPLPTAAKALAQVGITTYWMYRSELHALGVPGVESGRAMWMLGLHLTVLVIGAMVALWWRDRRRRA